MMMELGVMMLSDIDMNDLHRISEQYEAGRDVESVAQSLKDGLMVGRNDWVVHCCAWMVYARFRLLQPV